MAYPNDPESPRPDAYGKADEPLRRQDAHYQGNYGDSQRTEDERLLMDQTARDNDNAARGLLLGIILASLIGLGMAWYFLTQREDEPVQQPAIIVPAQESSRPTPEVRERIIEKETNTITVPTSQPSQAPPAAPDNITLPTSQPSQAPAAAPEINNNITVPSGAPQSASPSDTAPTVDTTPTETTDPAPAGSTPPAAGQ
ncbi:MAG TPA: hypothetical protein V6D03_09940 [Candidatus Caenarcaniphilales bacterium]